MLIHQTAKTSQNLNFLCELIFIFPVQNFDSEDIAWYRNLGICKLAFILSSILSDSYLLQEFGETMRGRVNFDPLDSCETTLDFG